LIESLIIDDDWVRTWKERYTAQYNLCGATEEYTESQNARSPECDVELVTTSRQFRWPVAIRQSSDGYNNLSKSWFASVLWLGNGLNDQAIGVLLLAGATKIPDDFWGIPKVLGHVVA
jgi:hypothetical protein